MSRTKDHLGGSFGRLLGPGRMGGSGGRDWNDVSPKNPCPVCGAPSWCQVNAHEAIVLCKRVEGDVTKENRDGVTYYVHHLSGERRRAWSEAPRAPARRVERANVRVVDHAYRRLLEALHLDDADREALRRRGLDDAGITAGEYRSLPLAGRAQLARAVLDAVGDDLAGVPGFAWQTEGGRGWWTLKGSPGLLIPCRDLDGRVAALKVRRRDPCEGSRYLYLSSSKHDGPSAASVVHVPVAARALRGTATRLVITEGELKADVSTALLGEPVVSIPGVGMWAAGNHLAVAWGARTVAVAFDMDAILNARVALARKLLHDELRRDGFDARLWRWDSRFKGLDDYLVARRREEV